MFKLKYIQGLTFAYILILTFAFLTPLEFFFVNNIVNEKNEPSNSTSFFIHFVLFSFMFLLLDSSFINKGKIIVFCLTYSILIEIMQIFTGRGFQILDILFNLIGIFFMYFFLKIFLKK